VAGVVGTVRGQTRTLLHDVRDRAGGRLEIETVDVLKAETIAGLRQGLAARRFDVLFVNAGVENGPGERIAAVSTEEFNRVMGTNALGPMRTVEALEGVVSPTGVIGVMSSGLGSIAGNENGGYEVYRASKAALNMLMRSFAARHSGDPRGFVIISPGWVRTDMGGPSAPLGIDDSIPGVVDAIASQAGKSGLRFLDYSGRVVPW
jgi:NAD(P)-dependent dehydrogenase (short-subunit alcohol dehydrogenase family)